MSAERAYVGGDKVKEVKWAQTTSSSEYLYEQEARCLRRERTCLQLSWAQRGGSQGCLTSDRDNTTTPCNSAQQLGVWRRGRVASQGSVTLRSWEEGIEGLRGWKATAHRIARKEEVSHMA